MRLSASSRALLCSRRARNLLDQPFLDHACDQRACLLVPSRLPLGCVQSKVRIKSLGVRPFLIVVARGIQEYEELVVSHGIYIYKFVYQRQSLSGGVLI